ncbi:MAG TPA: hypothetical protein VN577_07775 [Terriglobales bacterium]|nr:hypothetical protein [Terriglobales bacterium]
MNSRALLQSIEDVLVQGLELLESVTDDTYAFMVAAPYSASIGKHYRHVVDHFECLVHGLHTGIIDYDNRERNVKLETCVEAARVATIRLIGDFHRLTERRIEASCSVMYTVGYHDDQPLAIDTIVAREIAYCVSHAIHHFAIIRLVCAEVGVTMPDVFGVAPSTLKYRAVHA